MAETNGRQSSEPPSSSSSDFYNTAVPESRATAASFVPVPSTSQPDTPASDDNGHDDSAVNDSGSEMEISDESSTPEPTKPPAQHAGSKRKLAEDTANPDSDLSSTQDDAAKKRKLGSRDLPPEFWQRIFLHLSPVMLARCLRVCRTFYHALIFTKAGPIVKKEAWKVRLLDSEAIWTHARKTFFPNLPTPLPHCTEWEMLQLVGGTTCHSCGRIASSPHSQGIFANGPGAEGVRVIWPFGIRTCGRCLENDTLKDVEILVSQASSLRLGLPYIFLTPDSHYIPDIQRHQPGGIPSNLRVSKVYYRPDVDNIIAESKDADDLGPGAADEWRKGLADRGAQLMKDAARWENWEAARPHVDLLQKLREYDLTSFPRLFASAQPRSAVGGHVNGSQQPQPLSFLPGPVPSVPLAPGFPSGFGTPLQPFQPSFQQVSRPVRDVHEVEAIRQARRMDIERRCMEFEPPLETNVLQRMKAFQDTMQITAPMNDSGWAVLKPLLLAQREAAELAEHQRQLQLALLQSASSYNADAEHARPSKEIHDKEYEKKQEPLRQRLGEYADECIAGQWKGGNHLHKDNAPAFAVSVLDHVYARYLEQKKAGLLPPAEPSSRPGREQGTPIPEPFLSLDNMKWVFESKIRPLTEVHRRELFICADCPEERMPKWFAFEGLMQHYGAKHTTAFSQGNIVVHWTTSEWPEEPPFHQYPTRFIAAEKKVSDHRNHGRPRHTPQTHQDSSFASPGSSKLLSENPLFSNYTQSSAQADHGHQPHHSTHATARVPSQGHSHAPGGPIEAADDMNASVQVDTFSNFAREVWDFLDLANPPDFYGCVHVQVAFHHAVARFAATFGYTPSLDLVTEALATSKQMEPIKNVANLVCQICDASRTDVQAQTYYARVKNTKHYTLSSLITHFKIMHLPQDRGRLYWLQHMIMMPEPLLIGDIVDVPEVNDEKLAFIVAAFPAAFPSQVPNIDRVQHARQAIGHDSGYGARFLDRLDKKKREKLTKKQKKMMSRGAFHRTTTTAQVGSDESLSEPNEHEYDPRRPLHLQFDPTRYDSDAARRVSDATSPLTSPNLNLAPETLAVLGQLNSAIQSQQTPPMQDNYGADRSPSVGRKESHGSTGQPPVQPDIAAILASLTGQPQPAQMNAPAVSNPAAGPSPQPYGPHTPSYPDNAHRYGAPPAGYSLPAEYLPQHATNRDSNAPQAHNSQSFEQNRAHSYLEPAYPAHNSPAPYTAVYDQEGRRYIPKAGPQHAPAWHSAQQPIQSFQIAPSEYNRPPSAGGHVNVHSPNPQTAPGSRQTYIDELGRSVQLIPIDAGPAPVQYLPHPMEQLRLQSQPPPPQQYHPGLQHGQVAQPMYYQYPGGQQQSPPGSAGGGHAYDRRY